jgi:hypothetical protein
MVFALLLFVVWVSGVRRSAAQADSGSAITVPSSAPANVPDASLPATQPPATSTALQALLAFKSTDVKFSVDQLMDILRDKRHEGWVLAAYPDPKTSRPLIGAGISLDLPQRDHPQLDPLNPNLFLEPSSADLWQAAGLDSARLTRILDQFQEQLSSIGARQFRKSIRDLPPQITDDDANQLLRIAIVQSIINARAYCRDFDQFSASQQMAMSQLVYQMGVNLSEFTQFLALINHEPLPETDSKAPTLKEAALTTAFPTGADYWKTVQQSLVHSQWARLYRARAVAVIAMLDPRYAENPAAAERRISAVVRPAVVHRTRGRATATTQLAANHTPHAPASRSKAARSSRKKKVST